MINISLKFVHKGHINNIPALVKIMALPRPGTSHYLDQWCLLYWRIYASLGLNDLINVFVDGVSEINIYNSSVTNPPGAVFCGGWPKMVALTGV